MAKKKVTHQAKEPLQEAPQHQEKNIQQQPNTAMDDAAAKLESLKSLNSRLLKETADHRQQVKSLVQANQALEIELNRYRQEKDALETELNVAGDGTVGMELEKVVVSEFVETQMGQMGDGFHELMKQIEEVERVKGEREAEIELLRKKVNELVSTLENERDQLRRVFYERDLLKTDFDGLFEEANGLRLKVVDMEKREIIVMDEVEKLRKQCEGLQAENTDKEVAIKDVMRERDLLKRDTNDSAALIEGLKSKIEGIANEKKEIEKEKSAHAVKVEELAKEVGQLSGIVSSLKKEKEQLAVKISELEKRAGEAVEKENSMVIEINRLVEELKKKDESIEILSEQKDSLQKDLDLTREEKDVVASKIDIMNQEKNEIEEVKIRVESEIVELQGELSELRKAIVALKETCGIEEEKNKQLVLHLNNYKDSLDRVKLQRDDIQRDFDDEKKNAESLRLELSDMEKKVEDSMDELKKISSAEKELLGIKKELESQIEILVKKKREGENKLSEAQSTIDDLTAQVKSAGINSERALAMLKKTVAMVCHDKEESNGIQEKLEEEIQPYATEFEAIKKAFRSKEKKVEDMKQELEAVQANDQRRKSFVTLFTTATTILAAASAVYVTKGR